MTDTAPAPLLLPVVPFPFPSLLPSVLLLPPVTLLLPPLPLLLLLPPLPRCVPGALTPLLLLSVWLEEWKVWEDVWGWFTQGAPPSDSSAW